MKKFKNIIAAFALLLGLGLVFAPSSSYAADIVTGLQDVCDGAANTNNTVCKNADDDIKNQINTIINIMLYIVGIIAVIMIVYGGIRFATSAGNERAVAAAKSTILYSVIGLVVAILAYAIVQFVFNAIK